ncbi:phospholipase D family protein [Halomonas daqiaonensis]|uniref:PLD phosphodiesterase domain-containing protein n=1 Tax=Halomonas daqiaonensis TaxID=650850 RepID=A0A1H7P0K1_9GAMM|nr:phospholipase D family protein [Halomonas daqiaonensis]SEL29004.1 hypothetical protein SAMN04488129_108145 [Halomonas daqiaonensis]
MPGKQSLNPEQRVLYGESLQPPPGYTFDAAVATTFSLDFETALAAPVSLALFAAETRDEILRHPLALLEGAERIAGRLAIFTDAGRILTSGAPHSRLCSLLERTIIEVAAPRGGAFHPKMWALRFTPTQPNEPSLLRLLVLSRNLTCDRSWDIALTLDGTILRRPQRGNRPLSEFIRRLPDSACAAVGEDTRALTKQLSEDIRRADWTLPEPFESVSFAVNGLGGKPWQPDHCARLGIISPFCDDAALDLLATLPHREPPRLISRSDELSALSPNTLTRFAQADVLDEMATTEDGEEVEAETLQGLHAKAFIAESGWDTSITVGSGNATRPALLSGHNVELFATLTGRRSRVGSVEQIMGPDGFGRLTREFKSGELAVPDPERRAAESRLEEARRSLCRSGLKLHCQPAETDDTDGSLWSVRLTPTEPLSLAGMSAVAVWPITRGDGHSREALDALCAGQPLDLGAMPLIDLTRFMAFRLSDSATDASVLFSTSLVLEGLPAERHGAILRWVIDSKESFLRYLRLLLAELGDPFGAALAAQTDDGAGGWRAAADDTPLLEEMVRALCRGGEQLQAIERLISRLESTDADGPDPIPPDFRTLWETFRVVLQTQESVDVS